MRRLKATRRQVPLDRVDEYDTAWIRLQAHARAAGCNAWRFRSAQRQDVFLEFLEWKTHTPPPGEVATAQTALDMIAPGNTDEWEEAAATE